MYVRASAEPAAAGADGPADAEAEPVHVDGHAAAAVQVPAQRARQQNSGGAHGAATVRQCGGESREIYSATAMCKIT